jgi:glutamyl-tRNA(Gln) amidotransferase subunit D
MYSESVMKAFSKEGIEAGDVISVSRDGAQRIGRLMPKIENADPDCVVIKVENGYNIGIAFEKGTRIGLVEKGSIGSGKMIDRYKRIRVGGAVSILGCGGTIASKIEYKTGAVFPAFLPEELVASFPRLGGMGKIASRQLFSLLSEDITATHWEMVAKEIEQDVKEGAEGIVIMHGTDVMGYTAAALSFMLQSTPVPVVLTGAQKSSDRGSSDNEMNLICSVHAAKSEIAHVGVCMHANSSDDYCNLHLGTRVRKMHTSARPAFQSINAKPLARVDFASGKVEPIAAQYAKRDAKRKLELKPKMNDNVALVHTYPGMKPKFIEKLSDYDGIVIAGTGMGHLPANVFGDKLAKPVLPALKELIASGIVVAMAPQTLYGRVDMNVYSTGRLLLEAGVIGNYCDWLPETAYVKLMWALGQEKKKEKVEALMLKNIAGEISERNLAEFEPSPY